MKIEFRKTPLGFELWHERKGGGPLPLWDGIEGRAATFTKDEVYALTYNKLLLVIRAISDKDSANVSIRE